MVVEVEVDYPEEGCQDHVGFIIIGTIVVYCYIYSSNLEIEFGNTYAIFPLGTYSGHT